MAQGKDLDGQLAVRSEESRASENQGAEEIQHGPRRWNGSYRTSMISRWSEFSGATSATGDR